MFPVVAAFEYGVWRILCKRTRYLLLAHAHIFLRGTATAHMRSNFEMAAGKISSTALERISFWDFTGCTSPTVTKENDISLLVVSAEKFQR